MKYATGSLRFSLDENSVPYYQQLITQIQLGIESGKLSAGDKLPSTRLLAESLGVSRSTTSRVYDQLIAEGVLVSEEKRGVFVSALPMAHHSIKNSSPSREGFSNEQVEVEKLSFDSGVDVTRFPAKEWAASMRRSWLNPDLVLLQGGYPTGYPALKEAIVDYLYRVRGLECVASQIVVTAGNRDSLVLLQHTFATLLQTDDMPISWWLESPTYPPIREVFAQHGKPYFLSVDENGPCIPEEHAVNVGVITPNNQYPLGVGLSPQRRQQWLRKLQEPTSNWWLVEDDYDNEFVYQGRNEVPFMQTASIHKKARDRVFFVGSFSKVLFRGLRLGFIVAPMKQAELLKQSQRTLGSSSSLPIQPAVADFMLQGSFDRHINRMRRHYRMKRDALLKLLEDNLREWFEWKKPRGGMHILIELKAEVLSAFKDDLLDKRIASELRVKNVYLFTLSSHYAESSVFMRQGFLMGYSGSTEAAMSQAVLMLQAWLKHNV